MEKITKIDKIVFVFHAFVLISFALVMTSFFIGIHSNLNSKNITLNLITAIFSTITGVLSIPAKRMYGLIWFLTALLFFMML